MALPAPSLSGQVPHQIEIDLLIASKRWPRSFSSATTPAKTWQEFRTLGHLINKRNANNEWITSHRWCGFCETFAKFHKSEKSGCKSTWASIATWEYLLDCGRSCNRPTLSHAWLRRQAAFIGDTRITLVSQQQRIYHRTRPIQL